MKLKLTILFICVLFCTGFVAVMYERYERERNKKNGFQRKIIAKQVTFRNVFRLGYNTYYLAGIVERHIYLGNLTTPFQLLIIDLKNSKRETTKIKIKKDTIFKSPVLLVDSPKVYLFDAQLPAIFEGEVKDLSLSKVPIKPLHFVHALL